MAPNINVLLTTFPGLGLPPTISIPIPSTSTYSDLCDHIADLLPSNLNADLILSTTSNTRIQPSRRPLMSLSNNATTFLPLRLTALLLGGKGGFGSQLRAAGGRMSSRKKRSATSAEANGSNRNLDGRRLRTITEAKNLAEYLALKPEMEAKEKEERKKRWQLVIEAAEKREEEIKRGGKAKAKGKGLSEEWMDDKEDAAERAREAVRKAMMGEGGWRDSVGGMGAEIVGGSSSSAEASGSGGSKGTSKEEDFDMDDEEDEDEEVAVSKSAAPRQRHFAGFDDEDEEFMSDSEVEEDVKGKGKAKA